LSLEQIRSNGYSNDRKDMVKKRVKVLVVYNHNSSWVKDDIHLLSKNFQIETYYYKEDKNKKNLSLLVKNADIVYVWFASYHGLKAVHLAKKYGKKVVTVASGYSVANLPEYNYGLAAKVYTRWIPKYILKNSDCIVAVSESNKKEILRLIKKHKCVKVIFHGVDVERFKPDKNIRKEKMVITVGTLDGVSFKRKGIDKFISVAKHFPSTKFVVIGKIKEKMKSYLEDTSQNVTFTGFVSDDDLLNFYQKAKVYAQFSFHEAFGCSVAEAMLCNCIPVVTAGTSLPEVVGDAGFTVTHWDEKEAAEAIKKALDAPDELGEKARERILTEFPLKKREKELIKRIEGISEKDK